jgi:transposase
MDYRKTTAPTVMSDVATLYVALELSLRTWLVALRSSASDKVSLKPLPAGDQAALFALIDRMQAELYAAGHREVRVVSCYEAGRDGFWLHRRLVEHGVESLVVDAASVAVPQHARRRKTDRLDVRVLLRELMALMRHESDCRVLRVPTPEDEDERQLGRERQQLVSERVAHVNRIKGLLALHGIVDYQPLRRDRRERLAELRTALNKP